MDSIISRFQDFYQYLKPKNIESYTGLYSSDIIAIDPFTHIEGIDYFQDYFNHLISNISECQIRFLDHSTIPVEKYTNVFIRWQLHLKHLKLSHNKIIILDGATFFKAHEQIFFQQHYFDLGTLLYENTPILGYFIKQLKKKSAAFT